MSINLSSIIVKESNLHGKGIFTEIDIPKDSIIIKIIGEEIDENECIRRENEDDNVYIFYKDENKYVDTKNSDKIKFINHNCDYNCHIEDDADGNLILVASRDICAGEELTIDYGYEEIYSNCSCIECDNKE